MLHREEWDDETLPGYTTGKDNANTLTNRVTEKT